MPEAGAEGSWAPPVGSLSPRGLGVGLLTAVFSQLLPRGGGNPSTSRQRPLQSPYHMPVCRSPVWGSMSVPRAEEDRLGGQQSGRSPALPPAPGGHGNKSRRPFFPDGSGGQGPKVELSPARAPSGVCRDGACLGVPMAVSSLRLHSSSLCASLPQFPVY